MKHTAHSKWCLLGANRTVVFQLPNMNRTLLPKFKSEYLLNHSLLCYFPVPVHNLVDGKSTNLILGEWMSILYFLSSKQESMIFYKAVRTAQQRRKWRLLEPTPTFIPNGIKSNTPVCPFSILLTVRNILSLTFSFNLKPPPHRFYLHIEVHMQNYPHRPISIDAHILSYTPALGAKIIHVDQLWKILCQWVFYLCNAVCVARGKVSC